MLNIRNDISDFEFELIFDDSTKRNLIVVGAHKKAREANASRVSLARNLAVNGHE